jgi:hypothetical protein
MDNETWKHGELIYPTDADITKWIRYKQKIMVQLESQYYPIEAIITEKYITEGGLYLVRLSSGWGGQWVPLNELKILSVMHDPLDVMCMPLKKKDSNGNAIKSQMSGLFAMPSKEELAEAFKKLTTLPPVPPIIEICPDDEIYDEDDEYEDEEDDDFYSCEE